MINVTNSDCLKLILCAIDGDWQAIENYVKSLDSKHNNKEFKALLETVLDKIRPQAEPDTCSNTDRRHR